MSWVGSWLGQWFGAWLGRSPAAPPVAQADAASGTIVILSTVRGLLEQQDGLRAALEITQTRTAIMSVTPIYRGDDVAMLITVLDADGAPVDITGDEIEVQVKAAIGAADPPLISKSVGDGVTPLAQTGDTLGQASVAIDALETDIAPDTYWLDVVHVRSGKRTHIIGPRPFVIRDVVNQR